MASPSKPSILQKVFSVPNDPEAIKRHQDRWRSPPPSPRPEYEDIPGRISPNPQRDPAVAKKSFWSGGGGGGLKAAELKNDLAAIKRLGEKAVQGISGGKIKSGKDSNTRPPSPLEPQSPSSDSNQLKSNPSKVSSLIQQYDSENPKPSVSGDRGQKGSDESSRRGSSSAQIISTPYSSFLPTTSLSVGQWDLDQRDREKSKKNSNSNNRPRSTSNGSSTVNAGAFRQRSRSPSPVPQTGSDKKASNQPRRSKTEDSVQATRPLMNDIQNLPSKRPASPLLKLDLPSVSKSSMDSNAQRNKTSTGSTNQSASPSQLSQPIKAQTEPTKLQPSPEILTHGSKNSPVPFPGSRFTAEPLSTQTSKQDKPASTQRGGLDLSRTFAKVQATTQNSTKEERRNSKQDENLGNTQQPKGHSRSKSGQKLGETKVDTEKSNGHKKRSSGELFFQLHRRYRHS
jgi:hypothetical protein